MDEELTSNQMALLDRNVLYLEGEVGGRMVDQVHISLSILDGRGSPPIEIRIYSDGGSVHAGLAIYDFLCRYEGIKTGIVYGYARSMGAIIL
jgi:ATP-dependent Clp protease protease subunit